MKPVIIIVIAVVCSVVAVLGVLEGIAVFNQFMAEKAFYESPAGQRILLNEQLEVLVTRATLCEDIEDGDSIEYTSKVMECKSNVREDVRKVFAKFSEVQMDNRVEFLNSHYKAFFLP